MSDGLISFEESEVKAGYLVQNPGWGKFKVLGYRKATSAAGTSVNYFVEVKVLKHDADPNMNNVEFTRMFNTSKGFKVDIVRFFVACNGGKDLDATKTYNFDDTVGVELEGYIQKGSDKNGLPVNNISDFRPLQG